jgi:hypothetical protein
MIVPGSILLGVDHPFGWYVYVQEKTGAKKDTTYWHNGSEHTPELVAALIAKRFPNVRVLKVEPCKKMPDKILRPIPPKHFQYGLLHPDDPEPDENPQAPLRPLWKPGMSLKDSTPFPNRKPLWPPHR